MSDDSIWWDDLDGDDRPTYCPTHDAELVWDSDAVGWFCPVEGCEFCHLAPLDDGISDRERL